MLESTPRPGLRPEEVAPSGQLTSGQCSYPIVFTRKRQGEKTDEDADHFCSYYQEYLDGTYDCVDRIVLNCYFYLAQSPGGFRTWWRQLMGSDDNA